MGVDVADVGRHQPRVAQRGMDDTHLTVGVGLRHVLGIAVVGVATEGAAPAHAAGAGVGLGLQPQGGRTFA